MATQVFNRFGDADMKLQVKQITLPDLSIPMQLGRREPFSLFIPAHRKIAARLINIFMGTYCTIHLTVMWKHNSKNYTACFNTGRKPFMI